MYERLGFETAGSFGMQIPARGSAAGTEEQEEYREVCMVWRPTKTA
jgi:hypothetical protein